MNHFARRQFNLARLHDLRLKQPIIPPTQPDRLCKNCFELEFPNVKAIF
jgi:hypothetical protein